MVDSDIVASLVLQTLDVKHVMYVEVKCRYSDVSDALLENNLGEMCVIGHESEKRMPVVLARKAGVLSDYKDGGVVYLPDLEEDIFRLLTVYLYCGIIVVDGNRNEEFLRWAKMWKIRGFVS